MSDLNIATLRFKRRPSPVIPEHRPLYKISQLLLVLYFASRGGRSSLFRLQLFNWALKDEVRAQHLYRAVEERRLRVSAWGFDPAVSIALRLAVAEGLIQIDKNGCAITEQGSMFIEQVIAQPDMLRREKATLAKIGKRVTERMVDEAAKDWSP